MAVRKFVTWRYVSLHTKPHGVHNSRTRNRYIRHSKDLIHNVLRMCLLGSPQSLTLSYSVLFELSRAVLSNLSSTNCPMLYFTEPWAHGVTSRDQVVMN
jgi:hypothetical protein